MNNVVSIHNLRQVPTASNASAAGIKAELNKLRKEHAACVNCESAKTGVGQRNIQRLDVQIQQLESRLSVQSESASSTAPASMIGSLIDAYA